MPIAKGFARQLQVLAQQWLSGAKVTLLLQQQAQVATEDNKGGGRGAGEVFYRLQYTLNTPCAPRGRARTRHRNVNWLIVVSVSHQQKHTGEQPSASAFERFRRAAS